MVFAKPDRKVINLMPSRDLSEFLVRAEKIISKLGRKLPKKY